MQVDEKDVEFGAEYKGKTYYFCSENLEFENGGERVPAPLGQFLIRSIASRQPRLTGGADQQEGVVGLASKNSAKRSRWATSDAARSLRSAERRLSS
jgi:hypothetical protein